MSIKFVCLQYQLSTLCSDLVTFPRKDYKAKINEYVKFIFTRINRNMSGGHKHHIIPKCLGGSNKKSNIVNLSEEEHLKAHELLAYIFAKHEGLQSAVNILNNVSPINEIEYDDYYLHKKELFNFKYHRDILFEVLNEEGYVYDNINRVYVKG